MVDNKGASGKFVDHEPRIRISAMRLGLLGASEVLSWLRLGARH